MPDYFTLEKPMPLEASHTAKRKHNQHFKVLVFAGLLGILAFVPIAAFGAIGIGSWSSSPSYPLSVSGQSCTAWSGYEYCVGGQLTTSGTLTSSAYFAPLTASGTGSWSQTSSYPIPIVGASCVVDSAVMVCVGGYSTSTTGQTSPVYYAPLSPSGIGSWTASNPYPIAVSATSCAVNSGLVYCIGGVNPNTGATTSSVYYATLSTIGVGTWTATTSYPVPISDESCTMISGILYCVGGDSGFVTMNSVYYSQTTGSGLGGWSTGTVYPISVQDESCIASQGVIFCVGGYNVGSQTTTNTAYHATVSPSVGQWTQETNYPITDAGLACVVNSNVVDCVGGFSTPSQLTNSAYYATITSIITKTTTTVVCLSSFVVGTSVACTASVSGSSPTGQVTWSQLSGSGAVSFGSNAECTLNEGSCQIQVTGTMAGLVTTLATYSGDNSNQGSSGTASFSVTKTQTALELTCSSPSFASGSNTVCAAIITGGYLPAGSVEFTSTSSTATFGSPSASCFLSGGTCQVTYSDTTLGSATIGATWAGDENNQGSSGTFAISVIGIPFTVSALTGGSVIVQGPAVSGGSATVAEGTSTTFGVPLSAVLTLTGSPDSSFFLGAWSGVYLSSNNPVQITVTGASQETAIFYKFENCYYTSSVSPGSFGPEDLPPSTLFDNGGLDVTVSGSASGSLSIPYTNLCWDQTSSGGPIPTLQMLSLQTQIQSQVGLSYTLNVAATGESGWVPLTPAPIVGFGVDSAGMNIKVGITPVMRINATVAGTVTVNVNQGADLTFDLSYSNGQWSLAGTTLTCTNNGPRSLFCFSDSVTPSISGGIRGSLGFEIGFSSQGLVDFNVTPYGYLEADGGTGPVSAASFQPSCNGFAEGTDDQAGPWFGLCGGVSADVAGNFLSLSYTHDWGLLSGLIYGSTQVIPSSITLSSRSTQTFTALVAGSDATSAVPVTWALSSPTNCGGIQTAGEQVTYTAPQQDCTNSLTATFNGLLPSLGSSSITVKSVQVQLTFSFQVVGRGTGYSASILTYTSGGTLQHVDLSLTPTVYYADAGTAWSVSQSLPGSPSSERWQTNQAVVGTASASMISVFTYYDQYSYQFSYSITGGGTGYSSPTLTCYQFGKQGSCSTLTTTLTAYWVDAGTSASATNPLIGSGASERWATATASVTVSTSSATTFVFYHQYPLSVSGGNAVQITRTRFGSSGFAAITSDWADAGTSATVISNGVWGRASGTGIRATSWNIDGDANTNVATTSAWSTSPIIMSATHIVNIASVTQYQLTLKSVGYSALVSCSATAIPGDTFWYDSGTTGVSCTFSGVFDRAGGTGIRVTSYQWDGGTPTAESTTRTFVTSVQTMSATHQINVNVITQYEVALDSGATSALASITSPSIPGDDYWYDSGTQVTLILHGVCGRAEGAGTRLSGYAINGGPSNPVLTTGTVTALNSLPLTSTESITTTIVIQYQLADNDPSNSEALITPPTVAGDVGWYDFGTSVTVSLNNVKDATSSQRADLVSCTLDSITTAVTRSNTATQSYSFKMNSSHTISASYQLQYLLTIIGGNGVATSVNSPTDDYWFDSGTSTTVSSSGVYGRSNGVGTRVESWQLDSGPVNLVETTGTVTTSLITLSAARTVTFATVTQYQMTMNSEATGALSSITHPTIPGDNGWYDAGTQVTAVFNYVWNISPQTSRLNTISYSIDGGTNTVLPRSGSGTFGMQIVMSSAHSITINSVTQYFVAAVSLYGTVSLIGSQTGDTNWFDSGSTATFAVAGSPVACGIGCRQIFAGWSGSGTGSFSGTNNPASTSSIEGPITETANWQLQYLLTIQTSGLSLSSYPTKVYLGGLRVGTAYDGSPYTQWLNADSYTGIITVDSPIYGATGTRLVFSIWSDSSFSNPHSSIQMTAAVTITADYETQYLLTVTTSPSGLSPSPTPATGYYDAGTSVSLTANTVPGRMFVYWQLDGNNESLLVNSTTVTMNGPHSAVAVYQAPANAVQTLISAVNGMNLQHGITASLDAKLDAALRSLNAGNNNTAVNHLNIFIDEVKTKTGKGITQQQAQLLTEFAQDIINAINS